MFILEELFCNLDDFCNWFEPQWRSQLISQGLKTRKRDRQMSLSEIMTILVAFPLVIIAISSIIISTMCVFIGLANFPDCPVIIVLSNGCLQLCYHCVSI